MTQDMSNYSIRQFSRWKQLFSLFTSAARHVCLLLLMLTLGAATAWGQTDYSGTYYIGSRGYVAANTTTNYYLCPTEGWAFYVATNNVQAGDNGQPFLTTYRCRNGSYDATKAVWIVEKESNSGCYYIKQALTGKYLVSNGALPGAANTRARVHLETVADDAALEALGDWALFEITYDNNHYDILPHSTYGRDGDNKYLVVNTNNYNQLDGNGSKTNGPTGFKNCGGIIGLFTHPDGGNAYFYLEVPAPTFSFSNGSVSISDEFTDVDIYYTTNGSNPTESSTPYDGNAFTPLIGSSQVKAIAISRVSGIKSAVATYNLPKLDAPTISVVIPDPSDVTTSGTATISTSVDGATIFYTTNNNNPNTNSSITTGDVPFTGPKTIKAVVGKAGYALSDVTTKQIIKVATPTFRKDGKTIVLECETLDAEIHYTFGDTAPADPTELSPLYSVPLSEMKEKYIKAIAIKSENYSSDMLSFGPVSFQCAKPVIKRIASDKFTITCSNPTNATIYYTIGGGTPTTSDNSIPSGTEVSITENLPLTIKAIAVASGFDPSDEATLVIRDDDLSGSGTAADPYQIATSGDFSLFITKASTEDGASASYILTADFSASGIASSVNRSFIGTFDGDMHTISNLGHALFNTVNGGVVKNVILDNVSISSGTNVGAICNEATGNTRIYNCGVLATRSTANTDEDGYTSLTNCSSTIIGSGYVGSIVGLLDDNSRVINCFSYAKVSGGSFVGGIVGYNNVATTASNLQTMVMNCMFYGEVSGTSIAPIYNGLTITNDGDEDGVNNFNYFRLESTYIKNTTISKVYNCALGAETRFLQRFEFFRYLLNSNRELAAWWATDDVNNKDEMMKWVMEPTQIGTTTPYPILKTPDKYASVVNYTPSETTYDETNRNKGLKLTNEGEDGVLHVTIQMGTNTGNTPYSQPSGAALKSGETGMFDLTITDKDFEHFNFNYGKVQLPYYNDYCNGNYTENLVVTGWKIVSITGGTTGKYSTGADVTYTSGKLTATPYNFADRKCTNKDLYGTNGSKRVFNQGAYWDVPEGVTAITIEPYWGKAVYLSDDYWDVTYKNSGTDAMVTASNVTTVGGGQRYGNGETFNGQTVYTSMGDAIASSGGTGLFVGISENTRKGHSVYDYAVVLVGNYHHTSTPEAGEGKPYTVTSVDLDGDNEPDYSMMLRFNGRTGFHPVRYDFLNLIGLGMAQKTINGTGSYNLGIMQPKYWFEVTNTALFYVTQFEYSASSRSKKPIILQGGVVEQWVTQQGDAGDRVSYFHVGGNVWFKEFHRGSHQDNANKYTPHPPLSVTGGDFAKFYLTGYYQSEATVYDDNAECYINGGRFGEMAGAGMEGIGTSNGKGNITWIIDNADIKEFYGGGINFAKPVHGNIHTIISNSHVNVFCGGPKFGDMEADRTVTTEANNTTFGTFFGAGYGGNSYNRYAPTNRNNVINLPGPGTLNNQPATFDTWNDWVTTEYTQTYNTTYKGVSTQIDYQFIPMSSNVDNVARLFVEFVGFSLATTHNVTSSLTGCKITGNFYGGGSLGKVTGNVTSTLTDCEVTGHVYGAGYSASLPTVEVDSVGFRTEPYYYTDLGTYRTGVKGRTTTYRWEHGTATGVDNTNHILFTTENLETLGTVTGNIILNIDGTTVVNGDVFGGGESSNATGNATVNMISGTLRQDVYGGGALANVDGNTKVNLIGGTVSRDVYGGGKGRLEVPAKAAVGTEGEDGYEPPVERVAPIAATVGSATVNLNGIDAADYLATYTTLTREGDSGPYTVADDKKGCVIGRDIFGCNNLNGTPLGDVTVHVYKTQRAGATRITNTTEVTTAKVNGTPGVPGSYDVQHVYGGGNLAAYEPTDALSNNRHTAVIIDGCDRTSIYQVYGGGNAASTPATSVDINGTFEIEEAFGGGNGKDDIVKNGVTYPNPGANVGYKDYSEFYQEDGVWKVRDKADADTKEERLASSSPYLYGTGEAKMNIHGGKVHRVYGGSNTKGNVRISAVTMLEEESGCPFDVDEAYGGGKSAPMDGASNLVMSCIPGLKAAYGGAEDANIEGDVTLNITNGYFDRVFGGNNVSGSIKGTITVNVEETGCKPIIIGQLYGGGNLAPYSAPSGAHGPTLNVRSFTSIGEIYGGGYGSTAVVTGDTYVNINVCDGMDYSDDETLLETVADEIAKRDTITFNDYEIEEGQLVLDENNNPIPVEKTVSLTMPTRTGLVGAINKVFGGGNAADVTGSTHVNIGTTTSEVFATPTTKTVNGTAVTTTDEDRTNPVRGANITGNVYGGGNAAVVTGDTNVVIGKDTTTP